MTAMHKPFKSAALGYMAVRDYVKDNTNATMPVTLEQIYTAVKDQVKNMQQVRDAVRKCRELGEFSAIREGQQIVIWWRGVGEPNINPTKPAAVKTEVEKSAILVNPVKEAKPVDMPEVQITKDAINILAGGVKITIQRY